MIFISGIHGVGKSYFCSQVKDKLNLNAYSASSLISELKKERFSKDKLIADIDNNQTYLLRAKSHLDKQKQNYLLDGHFCLLDSNGHVKRIGVSTFTALAPQAIILLTEKPSIIAKRRKQRDGLEYSVKEIQLFQKAEIDSAYEVACLLAVPLYVSKGADYIEDAIKFIYKIVREG